MKAIPRLKALKALFRRNRANALVELEDAKHQLHRIESELDAVALEEASLRSPAEPPAESTPAGRLVSGSLYRDRRRERLDVLTTKKTELRNRLDSAKENLSKATDSVAESQNALNSLARREER